MSHVPHPFTLTAHCPRSADDAPRRRTRHRGDTLLVAALLAAGAAQAAPTSSSAVTDPPIITVFGDANRNEPTSGDASIDNLRTGCAYSGYTDTDVAISDHIAHFVGRNPLNPETGTLSPNAGLLSRSISGGRFGDASTELERRGYDRFGYGSYGSFGGDDYAGRSPWGSRPYTGGMGAQFNDALHGCTWQNMNEAMARAQIRARDRSLIEARMAYQAKDYPKALELFKHAYHKIGYDNAGLMLGKMYAAGEGTQRNPKEAVWWLDRVALSRGVNRLQMHFNPGNPYRAAPGVEARVLLGNMYVKGDGVAKDPAEARYWYKQANENDYLPARYVYARMLETGYGGSVNLAKAFKLYKDAAEHGFGPAQVKLAEMYASGDGVERDLSQAFKWYQQAALNPAADAGKARAQVILAEMYDRGEGVAADPAKALAWYKQAAVAGHPGAMNALATYFYKGELVAADAALSRKLFIEAALRGNPDGMVNSAAMAYRGEGGPRNPVQAYAMLSLAKQVGKPEVQPQLDAVASSLTPEQKAQAEALLAGKSSLQ